MTPEARASTRARKAGEYTEPEEIANIKPVLLHPDVEYDPTLAPHCSFPSIPVDQGPGRSELFKMERDAKEEKKKLRREKKITMYRDRRRAEKEIERVRKGLPPSEPKQAKEIKEKEKSNPRGRGRPPKAKSNETSQKEDSETDLEDIEFSDTTSDEDIELTNQKQSLPADHRAHVVHLPPRPGPAVSSHYSSSSHPKVVRNTTKAAREGIQNNDRVVIDEPHEYGLDFSRFPMDDDLPIESGQITVATPNADAIHAVAAADQVDPETDVEMLDEDDRIARDLFHRYIDVSQCGLNVFMGSSQNDQSLDEDDMASATLQIPRLAPVGNNYMLSGNRPDAPHQVLPVDMWTPEMFNRSLPSQHQLSQGGRNDTGDGGDNTFSQLDCDSRSEAADDEVPILLIDGVTVRPGRVEWEDLSTSVQHAILHLMTQKANFMTVWLQRFNLDPGDTLVEFFRKFRQDWEKHDRFESRAHIVETVDFREFAAGIGMENPYKLIYIKTETYATDSMSKKQLDDGLTFLLAKHQEPWIKQLSDWFRNVRQPHEFYPIYLDGPVAEDLIEKTKPAFQLNPVSQRAEDYKEVARGAWKSYDIFNGQAPADVVAERERRLAAWIATISHRFEAELIEKGRRAERAAMLMAAREEAALQAAAMEASSTDENIVPQEQVADAAISENSAPRDISEPMEEITASRSSVSKNRVSMGTEFDTEEEEVESDQEAADDTAFVLRKISSGRRPRKSEAEKAENKRKRQAVFAARRAAREAEKQVEKERKAAEKQAEKERKAAEKEAANKAAGEQENGRKSRKPYTRGPYKRKKTTMENEEEEEADKSAEEKGEANEKQKAGKKKRRKKVEVEKIIDKKVEVKKIVDKRTDAIREQLASLSPDCLAFYNQLKPPINKTLEFDALEKEKILESKSPTEVLEIYNSISAKTERREKLLSMRTGKLFMDQHERLQSILDKDSLVKMSMVQPFGVVARAKKLFVDNFDGLPSPEAFSPPPSTATNDSQGAEDERPGLDEVDKKVYFELNSNMASPSKTESGTAGRFVFECPESKRQPIEVHVDKEVEKLREYSSQFLWDAHENIGIVLPPGKVEEAEMTREAHHRYRYVMSRRFARAASAATLRANQSQSGQLERPVLLGTPAFGVPSASRNGEGEPSVEHESLARF